MKLIVEELEAQLDDINNGHTNNKNAINNNQDLNNNDNDNKYKNLFCKPNNSGLINHLKKENERLRKLIISYELKSKRYNNNMNNNIYKKNLSINKFYFEILKKKNSINLNDTNLSIFNNTFQNSHRSKEKKDIRLINKDYKYNKSIGTIRKNKNYSKVIKKPEIKKIKDINMFDNDYNNYLKENRLPKYNDIKIFNDPQKIRTNSLSQKKRKIINGGSTIMNSNTMRVKNVITTNKQIIPNNILQQYKDLSASRSHSKIIKRKKLYNYSFNNSIKLEKKNLGIVNINPYEKQLNYPQNDSMINQTMRTMENRRINNESYDKDFYYSASSRQKHSQIIKNNSKNKEIAKDVYYQKPIINKITIYNNINNGYNNHLKQKINLNEKPSKLIFGKKKSHNKSEYNNYNFRI